MAKNRLTGPGGFIDISQSTRDICFMTTLTAKGLEVSCPGDGSLKIDQEGKVKKFVPEVFEKTFSGDEAVRRGQKVFYVTERAVFRRTAKNDVIELIEVAEGVDVQKDVIDQMEFTPAISPNLKKMDPRIFKEEKMNVTAELFGSLEERCSYQKEDHTMFLDLFGINLNTKDDVVSWIFEIRGDCQFDRRTILIYSSQFVRTGSSIHSVAFSNHLFEPRDRSIWLFSTMASTLDRV